MKKVLNALLFLIMLFSLASCKNSKEKTEIDLYIDSLIQSTPSYVPSWNQEGFKGKWNYIDGVFLKSIIDQYEKTDDDYYIDFVIKYVNYYIDEDGYFKNLKDNKPGFTAGELDSVCESRILFDLYEYTEDSRYLKAIDKTYNELISMNRCQYHTNFWHKNTYHDQIWLDGFYMYVPFYIRYANMNNKKNIYEEVYCQYKNVRDYMFDENKKLYYHAMDVTKYMFWADSKTGLSKSFWLRGIGWFITSLADMLEYYPKDEDYYDYLKDIYKEAIDGILLYKDNDTNMFYQVVDKKGESANVSYDKYLKYLNKNYTEDTVIDNYLESSGSSLIAYSILKGCKLGILDEKYKQIGTDIFNGVLNHSFKDNKLNDICIMAGLGPDKKPYRDGSFEYYLAEEVGSNDAKGVGPFIMAYLEI